jgi:hypothetical protein
MKEDTPRLLGAVCDGRIIMCAVFVRFLFLNWFEISMSQSKWVVCDGSNHHDLIIICPVPLWDEVPLVQEIQKGLLVRRRGADPF